MSDRTVADTIMLQMGGYGKISTMIGAKHFVYSDDSISFRFPGARLMNYVTVTLQPDDLYTMTFFRVKLSRPAEIVAVHKNLYWDMLIPTFEGATGLYLRM